MFFDSKIGELGKRISGGQRQRIGIARATYDDPEIIFFDEATNSLDHETEKDVMRTINALKNNKTLVIIAHRLSTIEDADLIYVLDKGKIIDFGKHEELLTRNKLYSQLQLQEELDQEY